MVEQPQKFRARPIRSAGDDREHVLRGVAEAEAA